MRMTDFWERMGEAFGPAYAASVAHDQVLAPLGGRTIDEAFAAGVATKDVWRAVCVAFEIPPRLR